MLVFVGASVVPVLQAETNLQKPIDEKNIDGSSPSLDRDRSTLYVGGDGPGNFSSIQDAVDAASAGDTVYVYSGIYYENVNIWKSISLIGQDKYFTVIVGEDTTFPTIQTQGYTSGIIIKGFSVKGNGSRLIWNSYPDDISA